MQIYDITRGNISHYWRDLRNLSGDLDWDYWEEEHFLRELDKKWSLSFYTAQNTEIKGYCIASLKEDCVWLHHLIVSSEVRGQGVGCLILGELERRVRQLSAKNKVALKVRRIDNNAISFYERNGFHKVGTDHEYSTMEKVLTEKVVAMHQPNYFPWPGYYYKLFLADIFVILDNVQYTKNGFINRNRIKGSQGEQWLTIPVNNKLGLNINEITFADNKWSSKHIKALDGCYKKSPYFEKYRDRLQYLLNQEYASLGELNYNLIKEIMKWLNLKTPIIRSSLLEIDGKGDDRLIKIVEQMSGNVYLSGHGGKKYQDERKFSEANIELRYYNFTPPVYTQLWGDFIPGLSILDMIFSVDCIKVTNYFEDISKRDGEIN